MSDEAWTDSELAALERTEEISLSTRRTDGTLHRPVTIWIGASDGQVYVRSGNGVGGSWYRQAIATGQGQLKAANLSVDVHFEPVTDAATIAAVSRSYHAKYGRYEKIYGQPIVTSLSESATLKVSPVARDLSISGNK
jgi:hypothetical protein